MSSSDRFQRIGIFLFVSFVATMFGEASRAQEIEAISDKFMLCNVYDHELQDNVLTFQRPSNLEDLLGSTQGLFIARLWPNPQANTPQAGVSQPLRCS